MSNLIPLKPYQDKLVEEFIKQTRHKQKWSGKRIDEIERSLYGARRYGQTGVHGEFRSWLFENGANITLMSGTHYLQFYDEHIRTTFILTYL